MCKRMFAPLFPLMVVVALVVAACGGAQPKETPTPAQKATPTPAPAATATAIPQATPRPTPTPQPTAAPQLPEPKYGGVLVFPIRADLPVFDCSYFSTLEAAAPCGAITGGTNVIRPKPENVSEIDPYVLKGWQVSGDGTVFTLQLREDVKWHDGTSLTAQDVKFWLDLENNPPKGRPPSRQLGLFGPISKVEVVNPLTLRVTLSEPRPNWLFSIMERRFVWPRHLMQPEIEKGNVTVRAQDIGNIAYGPFKFKSYQRGSVLKVERSSLYFLKDKAGKQLPYLNGIDFVIITDPQAMVAAFRTGRVDGTAIGSGFHLTQEQIDVIKRSLGDQVYFGSISYVLWAAAANLSTKPWDDLNLRKAISLYIDRQAGCQAIHSGLCTPSALWSPGTPYRNPDVLTWPGFRPDKTADRAEARRLIKAGGYAGLSAKYLSFPANAVWGEFVVSQLRELGLNIELELLDRTTMLERIRSGAFQMTAEYPTADFPEKGLPYIDGTNPTSGIKPNDPRVTELSKKILTSADPAQRVAAGRELERYLVLEKAYYAPLWSETAVLGYRSYMKGVRTPAFSPTYNMDFETVWLDK